MSALRHTFPREQRLRSKRRIDALFGEGRGGFVYPIRYVVLSGDTAEPEVSVLVSVPKRYHKRAYIRNRLKRRIREAYRLHKEPLRDWIRQRGKSLELALLYTTDQELDYRAIERAVVQVLDRVMTISQH